jgi:hypothetical protein
MAASSSQTHLILSHTVDVLFGATLACQTPSSVEPSVEEIDRLKGLVDRCTTEQMAAIHKQVLLQMPALRFLHRYIALTHTSPDQSRALLAALISVCFFVVASSSSWQLMLIQTVPACALVYFAVIKRPCSGTRHHELHSITHVFRYNLCCAITQRQ